jgi:hypoxanthine-DNA glycosylase
LQTDRVGVAAVAGQVGQAGLLVRQRAFAPVAEPDARLLILGSFPGRASLSVGHYYAHPRNQFWPILESIIGEPLLGLAFEDRYRSLARRGIALWDVIAECERRGSLDAAIRSPRRAGLLQWVESLPELRAVLFNGSLAARHGAVLASEPRLTLWRLPSTSPAHASLTLEQKRAAWQRAFESVGRMARRGGEGV